mmetsp:Transcript_18598/g.47867  ORF Transcript_18598/g.47867 Transcript_18598/m.47867 type:complete len:222 (+) Transcript_18598:15-680(+)
MVSTTNVASASSVRDAVTCRSSAEKEKTPSTPVCTTTISMPCLERKTRCAGAESASDGYSAAAAPAATCSTLNFTSGITRARQRYRMLSFGLPRRVWRGPEPGIRVPVLSYCSEIINTSPSYRRDAPVGSSWDASSRPTPTVSPAVAARSRAPSGRMSGSPGMKSCTVSQCDRTVGEQAVPLTHLTISPRSRSELTVRSERPGARTAWSTRSVKPSTSATK